MGGIAAILRFQWKGYWRRYTRVGNVTAGNQGVLLIISCLILWRYARQLSVAAVGMANGDSAILEKLLGIIFIAWMFPLLSNSQLSIAPRDLFHLPLSIRDLFVVRTASLLMLPYAWLILIGSLAICLPLASAPHPLMGMAAALLFIVLAWAAGLVAAQLVSVPLARKLAGATALVLLAGFGLHTWANIIEPENLSRYAQFSPARLVARAALSPNDFGALGAMFALAVIALNGAWWSFRVSLNSEEIVRARRNSVLARYRVPGKFGELAMKDSRQFRQLLDPYLGLLIAVLGGIYLVTAGQASPAIFWAFIIAVFVPNASVAFNCFGLETRFGLERYSLLPLNGREIISGKNLAFVMVVGAQVIPLILIAWVRVGIFAAAGGIIVVALSSLAYLAWGNWVSVHHPFKMMAYRFSSGGSPFEAMAGIVFGSLPAAIAISLLRAESMRAVGIVALMLATYAATYFFSLTWAGKKFERRRAGIAISLS